jgi:hypothetical protein
MSIQWLCSGHNSLRLPLARTALAFLYIAMPAYSQRLLLGVKVAGQITNTFTYPALPQIVHEDRVRFGPMGELRLPRHVSFEVDALYKTRLDYTDHFFALVQLVGENRGTDDFTAHSWEIPILLKWHSPVYHSQNSLFAAAGLAARNVSGITHVYGTVSAGPGLPITSYDTRTSDGDIVNHWTYGPVVAAGIDIRASKFHFQPELRYTRWNDSPFSFVTKMDNLQALIGIAVGK